MDAGAVPGAAVVGEVAERYGVPCWWGRHTRTFWALVPADGRLRLVEALTVRELVTAITHPCGWPWP